MTQADIFNHQTTMTDRSKIIVLDDDPTGSQTVHSCLLLTKWDVETLKIGLMDEVPIFFILTNTRALPAKQAAAVTREVCQNLKIALAATKITEFLVVSRSDSTLRGHYPIETDVIAAELGGFDAHFLMPAFFEGGRITRDSIHYLLVDGSKPQSIRLNLPAIQSLPTIIVICQITSPKRPKVRFLPIVWCNFYSRKFVAVV